MHSSGRGPSGLCGRSSPTARRGRSGSSRVADGTRRCPGPATCCSAAASPAWTATGRSIPTPCHGPTWTARYASRDTRGPREAIQSPRLADPWRDPSSARLCECGIARPGAGSGHPHPEGRFLRVELRGLRQAAFGMGPPRAAEVGLQGVPEQALPEGRRRGSPGAEPGADAAGATTESTQVERRGGVGQQGSNRARASITGVAAVR